MQRVDRPFAIGCGVILLIIGLVPWGMGLADGPVPAYALILPTVAAIGGLVLLVRARRIAVGISDGVHGGTATRAYPELGASSGSCAVCGRAVYAIPGPALMRLVMGNEDDKVRANAMWCLSCDTLHCMGCAGDSQQQCSKCGGALGDTHHRRMRPTS